MKLRPTHLLALAIPGAVAFAFAHDESITVPTSSMAPAAAAAVEGDEELPPDHPPVGGGARPAAPAGAPEDEVAPSQRKAAIEWKVPVAWPKAPNPSSMRIATHRVPKAAGDTEDGDLSVARAGGDVESNIERWVGQLDGAGKEKRRTLTVAGLRVSVVEVDGSYEGMGQAGARRSGWALLGAVVEAKEEPYFFKLTGPAATVHAARGTFDALIASIKPL